MARRQTGSVHEYARKDGLATYSLRITAYGERYRVRLGTNADGWTRERADRELADTLALIRAGVWKPPQPAVAQDDDEPTFHVFASRYLEGRRGELRPNTYADYRWRLVNHLLPFFAEHRVSEIDVKAVDDYRVAKVQEREGIKSALTAGADLRDERGGPIRPLGNESINKTLLLLAAILDMAVDHDLLASNPARGKRRRLKTVRPRRPFLESDEIASLLAAAEELDRTPHRASDRALEVRRLRDCEHLTYPAIAKRVGMAVSTAHYLYRRASIEMPEPVLVRRTIVAVLVGAGLRVSELCNLVWRDVDLRRGHITIADAKTEAGVREVRLTPWCIQEMRAYRASLGDVANDDPVFPTAAGTPRDRRNVGQWVVKKAASVADERRLAEGRGPLPTGITPHALRCTYISLLLEAGYSLRYVMGQVGHEDESTTLRIYARVLKRRARTELDEAFDRLLDEEAT
jgi:integrase